MKCAFIDLGSDYGGAEKYLLTIIREWINKGQDAFIIARYNTNFWKECVKVFGRKRILGIDFKLRDVRRLKKFLTVNSIDVISVNGINSGIAIQLARTNIPIVTTVHSNAAIDRTNKPKVVRKAFVILENHCLRKSKKIIVVSKALRDYLIKRHITENKMEYIPNGVDYIEYGEKKYRTEPSSKLKICYVGRLEEVKGCRYLIEALGKIKNLDYICDIYGEGSQSEVLEKKVVDLNIDEKVHFVGFRDNVRDYLDHYDLLVMPSLYEGFPLTIPEAMNARCTLLCSNVGGIPYIIDDGKNGILFQARNINELAKKIIYVSKNPLLSQTITENAYQNFLNNYTTEKMINKTFSVLERYK